MTTQNIRDFFTNLQAELSALVIMDLLSAAEGRLRDDFEKRVQSNDSSNISRNFRVIAEFCVRDRRKQPHPVSRLLAVWAKYVNHAKTSIALFNEYWPYRNWLAHGRWNNFPGGQSLPPADDFKDSVEMLLSDLSIPLY